MHNRRMIGERESVSERRLVPVHSGNERNAIAPRAVTRPESHSHNPVKPAVLIVAKVAGDGSPRLLDSFEQREQTRANGNDVEFLRACGPALRIAEFYLSILQVDSVSGNRGFSEATASIAKDLLRDLHPIGFFRKRFSQLLDLLISQFRRLALWLASDAHFLQRISLDKLPSLGFGEDRSKKLQLQKRGIVTDILAVNLRSESPLDVRLRVDKPDLGRIDKSANLQELPDCPPRARISAVSVLLNISAVHVGGNPKSEASAISVRSVGVLLGGQLISFAIGLTCVERVIPTKAGRGFHPVTGIRIAGAHVPKGGPLMLTEKSHAKTVSDSPINVKSAKVAKRGGNAAELGFVFSTITLRGSKISYENRGKSPI